MLTNEEIIERYGNHPGNTNHNVGFPEGYILCDNCPVSILNCGSLAPDTHNAGYEDCYNRIRNYFAQEGASKPASLADTPQEDKADVDILYICDRRACEVCDPNCRTTRDIRHAKNFELKGRTMVEIERVVPPTYTV